MLHNSSRHMLGDIYLDDSNRIFTGFRDRILYEDVDGVVAHEVQDGDTLKSLAFYYYQNTIPRSAGLWWAIADFQPTPILDPTIKLKAGEVIFIPPIALIQQALHENPA